MKTNDETIEAQMYFKSKERGVLKFYKAKSNKWSDCCKYCLLWRTDECEFAPCEAEERHDGQEGYFSIKNIPPTL